MVTTELFRGERTYRDAIGALAHVVASACMGEDGDREGSGPVRLALFTVAELFCVSPSQVLSDLALELGSWHDGDDEEGNE